MSNPGDDSYERLTALADAEVRKQAYLQWRARFGIRDFDLAPGQGVSLYLPTLGIEGVGGKLNDEYVVMQTIDSYARGRANREIEVMEKVPPEDGDPE